MKFACLLVFISFICFSNLAYSSKIIFKRRLARTLPLYDFAHSALVAIVGGSINYNRLTKPAINLENKLKSCINRGWAGPSTAQIRQELHFSKQFINSHLFTASRFLSTRMFYRYDGRLLGNNVDTIVYNVCKLRKYSISLLSGNNLRKYLGRSVVLFRTIHPKRSFLQNSWMIRIKVTKRVIRVPQSRPITRIRLYTRPIKKVFSPIALGFMRRVISILTPVLHELREFVINLLNTAPIMKRALEMFTCLKKMNINHIRKEMDVFSRFILASKQILLKGWDGFVKVILNAMCNDWNHFKLALKHYSYAMRVGGRPKFSLLGSFVGYFVTAIGRSIPAKKNKLK